MFVTGTGILDKRSFLPGGTTAGNPDAVTGTVDPGSQSWVDWLDVISLVALAIVAILVVAAVVTRRSPRR